MKPTGFCKLIIATEAAFESLLNLIKIRTHNSVYARSSGWPRAVFDQESHKEK